MHDILNEDCAHCAIIIHAYQVFMFFHVDMPNMVAMTCDIMFWPPQINGIPRMLLHGNYLILKAKKEKNLQKSSSSYFAFDFLSLVSYFSLFSAAYRIAMFRLFIIRIKTF